MSRHGRQSFSTTIAIVAATAGMWAGVMPLPLALASRESTVSAHMSNGTRADNRMQRNLEELGTDEETYFVDHGRYGTASALRSQGYENIKLTNGQFVAIHLGHQGYCFAGRVAAHHYFMYASLGQGLYGPRRTDKCSPTVYPHAAGRLRPS